MMNSHSYWQSVTTDIKQVIVYMTQEINICGSVNSQYLLEVQ